MKKLYSLATLLMLTLLSFTATAKSYTVTVNDPSLVKSFKSFYPETFHDFEGQTTKIFDMGDAYSMTLECIDGYAITSVKSVKPDQAEVEELSSVTNTYSASLGDYSYQFPDGTTFNITIEELSKTTFTLKVDDYTHLASVAGVETLASNEFEVSFTPLEYNIEIVAAQASNGKYLIKSVTYAEGDPVDFGSGVTSYGLDTSKINEGDEVEIVTTFKELPNYTIEVTDIAHINQLAYKDISTYNPTGNSFTLVTEDTYFALSPANGCQILSVKCGEDDLVVYESFPYHSSSPMYVYLRTSNGDIASGSTITIETEERTFPKWTFTGAEGIQFKYNDNVVVSNQDVFEYQIKGEGYLYISCTDSDFRIKSVIKEGSSYGERINDDGVAEIYISSPVATTYDITKVEYVTGTVTIMADQPSLVSMQVGNKSVYLTEGSNEVVFDSTNPTIQISHATYGSRVYAVKVNDKALTRNTDYYGTFSFDAADGDEVEITVAFPEIDVPVSFSFGDEDVTNVISSVKFGYYDEAEGWAEENFKVSMGKTLNISFDTGMYENITLTANGKPVEVSYGSASYTVESEEPIEFVISATKVVPNKMTIHCEQWEHMIVYRKQVYNYGSYTLSDPVELTGPTTEIEFSKNLYMAYFQAQGNYYIAEAPNMTSPAVNYSVNIEDGKELTFVLEELKREEPVVVFMENADAAGYVTLTQENTNFRGSFDVNYSIYSGNIEVGYNMIYVGENDQISFSTNNQVVYVNGVRQDEYYVIINPIPENTVIKVFSAEPEMFDVKYAFGEDVEVEVYHDHLTKMESPNEHSVHAGTHVAIKPVTPSVAKAAPAAAKLNVKINNVELTPNDEGIYEFTVNNHVNVAVEKDIETGLESILVDGQEADIYNLQGIKVGTTANFNALTPGIYIINGVKIRL